MDTDKSRELVSSFIDDVVNTGHSEHALKYVAPDFTLHNPGETPTRGPALLRYFDLLRTAFPDFRLNIEELVAEGDRVVVIGTQTGTHEGDYKGLPPAGRAFKVRTHVLYRLRGSSIVEAVHVFDRLEMMEQLQRDR